MSDLPRRVAITGASGYIGQRLIERLESAEEVESILALDLRHLQSSSKLHFHARDVNAPLAELLLEEGVEALVHLAFVLRPGHNREAIRRINVGGTTNVVSACAQAGVKQVLYLSSTTIYGAHQDNPMPLTEESPIRPVKGFQYAEDKAAVEGLLDDFGRTYQDRRITVLRGCVVMGPRASNFVAQALSKPFLLAIQGHDPPMQFLHEDDLVEVLLSCLKARASGVYNIAGREAVPWREMARMSRRTLITLPAPIVYGLTELAWKLRLQRDSPASGLEYIRYPWVASTDKIERELGIQFRYSSREALEAFLGSISGLQAPKEAL